MPAARNGRRRQQRNGKQSIPRSMPSTLAVATGPGATHTFLRSMDFTLSLPKGAVDQGYALSFALDDLPSYTEFTNLFDKYRVDQLDCVFLWEAGNAITTAQSPCLWIAADWDGVSGSPTLSSVMQYPGVRMHAFSYQRPTFQYSIKRPAVLQTLAGGSNGAVVRSPWLATTAPSVEHYGLIGWVNQYNSTVGSGTIYFSLRAHLSFLAPR